MRKLLLKLLMIALTLQIGMDVHAQSSLRRTASVTGVVYDLDSGQPIPFVTVQAMGTGKSTLTNADGHYRLLLEPGDYNLKFSHIGYYSEQAAVVLSDSVLAHDVRMRSSLIEIEGIRVYREAYDPAQQIIVEAIRRKQDILSQLHDYSYDAYSKFAVYDEDKPDSAEIFLIAESQTTSFWEQPDSYKEIITARKQTANIPAEGNLLSVGEILNFNKNRLDIAEYSVVTPTARDALDHYRYYLMDTVFLDSQVIYVLEIEPRSQTTPLFVGTIHIADSTYDVVMVDVGFNEAVRVPLLDSIRYSQRFAQFQNEYWMPIEIRFSGRVKFNVPLPSVPSRLSFDYVASLYSFSFEEGHPDGTFDEYALEVDEDADDIDSLEWQARQTIPLTVDELTGYERIDSIANAPKSVGKWVTTGLAAALAITTFGDADLFHFNRVEGAYAGLGMDLDRLTFSTDLWFSGGYAFDAKDWSFRLGLRRELWKRHRLWVAAEGKNRMEHRPTVFAGPGYNSTLGALYYKSDPFDYYREKGFRLLAGFRPINHTRLRVEYSDYRQTSAPIVTDYSFFGGDDPWRPNPAIAAGHLRSLSARFTFDSRKRLLNKGKEYIAEAPQYLTLTLGVEHASPDLIDNDFDFTRYYARLRRQQRTLGLGLTTLEVYWGDSDRDLPPQKGFVVDHSDPIFFGDLGFKTTDENNYYGSRILSVYLNHRLGESLFKKTGVPLIKNLPIGVGIHGGAFWTDFDGGAPDHFSQTLPGARTAYSEIGFNLTNLTPFLSPFNFALSFTWQLSAYDTSKFSWQLGLRL